LTPMVPLEGTCRKPRTGLRPKVYHKRTEKATVQAPFSGKRLPLQDDRDPFRDLCAEGRTAAGEAPYSARTPLLSYRAYPIRHFCFVDSPLLYCLHTILGPTKPSWQTMQPLSIDSVEPGDLRDQ